MYDLQENKRTAGTGGKYRTSSSDTEVSADERADWGGEETEELASEEDAAMGMGAGASRMKLTATVGGSEKNGADGAHGGAASGRSDAGNDDEAGAGDRHGARTAAR